MFALILACNFSLTNDRAYSAYHIKLPHLNVNVTYGNIFITAEIHFSLPPVTFGDIKIHSFKIHIFDSRNVFFPFATYCKASVTAK